MAQKNAVESKTRVRRITAKDDETKQPSPHTSKASTTVKKTASKTTKKIATETAATSPKQPKTTAKKSGDVGYFKGAWQELKLVRWPTRSATWSMTAAVLVFTLIFVVLILLLDAGFNWGFNQILK